MNKEDSKWMKLAIKIAKQGLFTCSPNPRVGCVLVKNGILVGKGWHKFAGKGHAEVNAIKSVKESIEGATCYVTLEPCCHYGKTPPCVDSLLLAKFKRVVIASKDPNPLVAGKGINKLLAAGIEVCVGVLEEEAKSLNPGFYKRQQCGLPYIRVKLATSLDGKIAMANGESKWITGTKARIDAHKYRASSDVLLTGVGTILHDDPLMNIRLNLRQQVLQPIIVILDSNFRTPTTAKILSNNEKVIIYGEIGNIGKKKYPENVELRTIKKLHSPEAIYTIIKELAEKMEINEIMVEAGCNLTDSWFCAGYFDEIIMYIAPKFLGHNAKSAIKFDHIKFLQDAPQFSIVKQKKLGEDLKLVLKKKV